MNLVCHGLAFVASQLNALPTLIKIIIAGLIIVSYLTYRKRFQREQHTLRYSPQDGWQLFVANQYVPIQIETTTVVTSFLIILHVHQRPPILIAKDALENEAFRRLSVKLKITAGRQWPSR
jgi:purine-cytosine permease-like protein